MEYTDTDLDWEKLKCQISTISDDQLICYCTNLTLGMLRKANESGIWPIPDKAASGNLCTGCRADILLLRKALVSK